MRTTAPTLKRTVFETSRQIEFFSEHELTMQIGFHKYLWPVALLKELLDNALDSCDSAEVLPAITVTLTADALSVQDNGSGLPCSVLERSLDYSVRISDKAHYVSPSRGQLGNALKCLWAASYVAHGTQGRACVETNGQTYEVLVALDPLTQQPRCSCTPVGDSTVKSGTKITLHYSQIASYLAHTGWGDFYRVPDLLIRYSAFNPHAALRYIDHAGHARHYGPTQDQWPHWLPCYTTSPHWYPAPRFEALLTAYLTADLQHGRVRTVRDVVAEFAGLSSTGKRKSVTEAAGLHGAPLTALLHNGALDADRARALLAAMQAESKPIKPAQLGRLAPAHLHAILTTHCDVDPATVKYKRIESEDAEVPFVLEVAFGGLESGDESVGRELLLGINWSPALGIPFDALHTLLSEAMVEEEDPVVVLVHLACPRVTVLDRGKTRVEVPSAVKAALGTAVRTVTKSWTTQKRQAMRDGAKGKRALEALRRQAQAPVMNVKQAAYAVMEEAYMKASGQGHYPANARQIMYAARPLIIALTDNASPWKNSSYFTQQLLPDYMEEHPEITAAWDVVFDARGHFQEPHTKRQFGIGTLDVRHYIKTWQATIREDIEPPVLQAAIPTSGPQNRYRYALFIEKEGFNPLLERARIAETYDLAIMSTKGMTVVAARRLIDELAKQGVTILVLHDFDKSGFEILHKFTADTRRYSYETPPEVIDLGLRLLGAQEMGLEPEPVTYPKGIDPRESLHTCGANEAECAMLVQQGDPEKGWTGARIELNAMTSEQFLTWLHDRLDAVGVEKYVPDRAALDSAFRRQWRQRGIQEAMERTMEALPPPAAIPIPDMLEDAVREALLVDNAVPWDGALWDIVNAAFDAQRSEATAPGTMTQGDDA